MRDKSIVVKIVQGILLGAILLTGCETAHDVAVTSFRVIDAPANYVRRHIDQPSPTAAPTTVASDSVRPGRTVSPESSPRPPAIAQTRPHPTATPRIPRSTQ